jgi:membrane-associated protease RseP (regulator of RpoE activity)
LCNLIYASGTIAIAVSLRVPFDEVALFVGPRLLHITRGGVEYRLNAIPLGSHVRFVRPAYDTTSVLKLVPLVLAGCAATFAMALLCLPSGDAVQMLTNGFKQFVVGAVRPRSQGAELVRTAVEFAHEHGFIAVLGATAAKSTAFNLLPIPNLAGGMAIMTILRPLWRNEGVSVALMTIGVLLTLALVVCWGVAIVYAFV